MREAEASGGEDAPSGVPAGGAATPARMVERDWRYGDPNVLIEERIIVATPEGWEGRPESADKSWAAMVLEVDGRPLVVASRVVA